MTIQEWFLLLALIGVAYASGHLRIALENRATLRRERINGLLEHTATGDVRGATRDVVMALAFVTFAAAPLLPVRNVVGLIVGLALLVLVTAFVSGMAFARLHELGRPRSEGRDDEVPGTEKGSGNGDQDKQDPH